MRNKKHKRRKQSTTLLHHLKAKAKQARVGHEMFGDDHELSEAEIRDAIRRLKRRLDRHRPPHEQRDDPPGAKC